MFRIRLRAIFAGANVRICTAFWLFGLINNVLYVIILTAALDLVGPNVPKGVVLLADVIPSFLMKLCAPYFIHAVPYSVRVILFVIISTGGMLLVALTPPYIDGGTIGTKMAGVVLASTSSGLGELSFLGLTHFYGPFSLAAWGSGTGGAGLIGAGAYALATSLGVGITNTLLASCLLPIIMLGSFFIILPRQPLKHTANATKEHSRSPKFTHVDEDDEGDPRDEDPSAEGESLLRQSIHSTSTARTAPNWQARFLRNLRHSRSLFFPFMLPLLLVYISEYTINLGVAPTLLFPLPDTPFTSYRAFYPTYSAIYQLGVFISRSSTPFIRIHALYPPSLLQILNLLVLTLHALFPFLPNVYFVFAVVFWEGLLGGAVYVNTFAEIRERFEKGENGEREFSLGAVSVSDSGGICVAGFLSIGVEVGICRWQVERGRDWCRRI